MARLTRVNSRGFTLVELLIVVAIIGVLSTIGVPTFRRMVTKAKKSEAKVGMGGLFTVESAFFTEYNVYGNRLDKVGFQIEGRQRLYSMGFPISAACGGLAAAATDYRPLETDAAGATLKGQIVDYYSAANGFTISQRQTAGAGASGANPGTYNCYVGTPGATLGFEAGVAVGVSGPGDTFIASATGNIAPGVDPATGSVTAGCTTGCQDVWVIDRNRNLANIVDGTN